MKRLMIIALIILFITIMFGCTSCTTSPTPEFTNELVSSYSELLCQGDFIRMKYEGDNLIIYISYSEKLIMPIEEFPHTLSLLKGADVKNIFKRNGDVYYVTNGFLDDIRGYVISKDFVIDMTELGKLERILTPCKYHMYRFSSNY